MSRMIDADVLYKEMQENEELARKRVLDTQSTLPCQTNLNPAYTRYTAQMDERTRFKEMIADALTITPERDIPKVPNSTEDHTWGVRKIVPVCPMCDTYLTIVEFIGDGKKISYCDNCGQCINWEGWEYE